MFGRRPHSLYILTVILQHDYRVIAPDLRGFGESEHPGDIESSGRMSDMVADLVCILEKEGITEAACVG